MKNKKGGSNPTVNHSNGSNPNGNHSNENKKEPTNNKPIVL